MVIHMIGKLPTQNSQLVKLVIQICHVDQQNLVKVTRLSCAACIATVLIIDNGPFDHTLSLVPISGKNKLFSEFRMV